MQRLIADTESQASAATFKEVLQLLQQSDDPTEDYNKKAAKANLVNETIASEWEGDPVGKINVRWYNYVIMAIISLFIYLAILNYR